MDAKVTLSFDEEVIGRAKALAEAQGISLSRLTELMYDRLTHKTNSYISLEDLPIASHIDMVAEGVITYQRKSKKKSVNEE